MIRRKLREGSKRRQRGITSVEMLIVIPLLVLLMLGAVDFGRVMYAGMTTTGAARAGAGWGKQTNGTAGSVNGIAIAVLADAINLPVDAYNTEHVNVTSRRVCRCVGGQPNEVDCVDTGCGPPEVYVEVTAVRDFRTLIPYPLIPDSVQISRTATMRVQ